MKPSILVTGATGAQGGSVARHLQARGRFVVRALTRHPDSDKAQGLRKAGMEVVPGDLADPAGLKEAMKGCYGVFGVTNFWEHFAGEYEQGRNVIDAVAASDIEHFVLSTLPHVKKITKGELDVPHFDLKGRMEEYARSLSLPVTFIHVAFYYENYLYFTPPQKQADGSFAIGFPQGDTPLSGVSVEDVGGVVATIFERPKEFIGQVVGIVGEDLTGRGYAEIMSRVTGARIAYNHIPREVFAGFGFPGAEDLANMFDYNRRYIPNRTADIEHSRALYPGMRGFGEWAEANREKLKALVGA